MNAGLRPDQWVKVRPKAGGAADNQRYEHISRVLARFDYPRRNKRSETHV